MKKCPYCSEDVQDDAIICRYCNKSLPQKISKFDAKLLRFSYQMKQIGVALTVLGLLFVFFVLILHGC